MRFALRRLQSRDGVPDPHDLQGPSVYGNPNGSERIWTVQQQHK